MYSARPKSNAPVTAITRTDSEDQDSNKSHETINTSAADINEQKPVDSQKNRTNEDGVEEVKRADDHLEEVPFIQMNMPQDELHKFVKEKVDILKGQSNYNSVTLLCIQSLWQVFVHYESERKKVGDWLAELGLAGDLAKMLMWTVLPPVKVDKTTVNNIRYHVFELMWDYTDSSRDFCVETVSSGIIESCIDMLKRFNSSTNEKEHELINACLGIVHNVSKYSEIREVLETEATTKTLEPYLYHDNTECRAVALMAITLIISEEKNAKLEDTGGIAFMRDILNSALQEENHKYDGFSAQEITECLGRMAVNDSNKQRMTKDGVLPMLVLMLQGNRVEEHISACKALWNLAFHKETAAAIRQVKYLEDGIANLKSSPDFRVKKMVNGLIWTLQERGEQAQHEKSIAEPTPEGHIFISYCWAQKTEVVRIKDALKAGGYKVWIDIENMGGSTLEAMADGIDKASLMLVCLSHDYKMSPSTKAEAEYAFQRKKPIVPLMLQRRYKPDGWLGMIMGAKLYMNFDGKYSFDEAMKMLEKELEGRGKTSNTQSIAPEAAALNYAVSPTAKNTEPSATAWTKAQVKSWLVKYGLQHKLGDFAEFDGQLFCNLSTVRREVPDFFYKYLKRRLHMNMVDICKLISALDNVPK